MSNTNMSEAFGLPLTVETGLEREMIYDRHHDFLLSVNEDVNPHAICRAVNSHDELVKALEDIKQGLSETKPNNGKLFLSGRIYNCLQIAEEALSKAGSNL